VELKYDDRADALYIRFSHGSFSHTEIVDDHRNIDYAQDGSVIGIEVLYPTLGVNVSGLPREASVGRLLEEYGFRVISTAPS